MDGDAGRIHRCKETVTIALVGKYVQLHDSYLSVAEALSHGGWENGVKVQIRWVDSESILPGEEEAALSGVDGIIVPGGFGTRGVEGMIQAAFYARTHHIPYFGICLGMQVAAIEFARNVAGLAGANSGEFAPQGQYKVIDLMPDQQETCLRAAPCGWGLFPVPLLQVPGWLRHMGKKRFGSATVTVMNSTMTSAACWKKRAWCFPASPPTAGW